MNIFEYIICLALNEYICVCTCVNFITISDIQKTDHSTCIILWVVVIFLLVFVVVRDSFVLAGPLTLSLLHLLIGLVTFAVQSRNPDDNPCDHAALCGSFL